MKVKRSRALTPSGASGSQRDEMGQCDAVTNMSRQGSEIRSLLALRQLVMRSRSGMNFAQTVSASIMHALRPACSSSALLAIGARVRPTRTNATTAPIFIDVLLTRYSPAAGRANKKSADSRQCHLVRREMKKDSTNAGGVFRNGIFQVCESPASLKGRCRPVASVRSPT